MRSHVRLFILILVLVALSAITLSCSVSTSTSESLISTPKSSLSPNQFPGMALVPAGAFIMGSEDGGIFERPTHEVYLDDFYIDIYEVINAEYAEFLNDEGNQQEGGVTWLDVFDDDARISQSGEAWVADSGYSDHPVVEVSWFGARAFCEWREARLPTEAEWEKAARGGLQGRRYPWGDENPVCRAGVENGAKFDDDSACDDTGTEPVGTYTPNGYGIYDMAGNVWEWLADWLAMDYYSDSPYENPAGPSSGDYRLLRGGSWKFAPYDFPFDLRVAGRYGYEPDTTDLDVGFRCARSP